MNITEKEINIKSIYENECYKFDEELKKFPDDDKIYIRYGNLHEKYNNKNDAIKCYKISLILNKKNITFFHNKVVLLRKNGDCEYAYNIVCNVLSIFPYYDFNLKFVILLVHQTRNPYYLIKYIYKAAKKNDVREAIISWIKNCNQNNHFICYILAKLMDLDGNYEKSLQYFDKASDLFPGGGWTFTDRSILMIKHYYSDFLNLINSNYTISRANINNKMKKGIVSIGYLGLQGRFGDQIGRYISIKLFAYKHSLETETPDWIGRYFFKGCSKDSYISGCYPQYCRKDKEIIDWINNPKIFPDNVKIDLENSPYSLNQANLKEKQFVFSHFEFHSYWTEKLNICIERLKNFGNTIVAIHFRYGDKIEVSKVQDEKLYYEWLDKIWLEFDKPVLYIASDDPDKCKHLFSKYNPYFLKNINFTILGLDFIIDYYILMNSDILFFSDSAFSKTASLLNKNAKQMYYLMQDKKIIPWNI